MDREEIREKALERARNEVSEKDRIEMMIKAVKALDAVKSSDQEFEAFRDWYSLHFPELVDEIEDDRKLVRVLSDAVKREELDAFEELAGDSTGMQISDRDAEALSEFASFLESRGKAEEELEDYVRQIAGEEMPNTSVLLGSVLAARIVGLAGGLEDLAKSPASKVQMLGAEKALFRHVKEGENPPKHGILFEHEFVRPLKADRRGKMARFLANKAVMAARMDHYGDRDKGEELREECREKFDRLKN